MFLAVNAKTKFFLMVAKPNSLEYFVPTSFSRLTAQGNEIKQTLKRYDETESLEIGPYVDLDYAPYTLILLNLFLNRPQPKKVGKPNSSQ